MMLQAAGFYRYCFLLITAMPSSGKIFFCPTDSESRMILGIIIWTARPSLLLFLAILIPLQVMRSRKEERVLTEKFGTEYLEYKRKTWF